MKSVNAMVYLLYSTLHASRCEVHFPPLFLQNNKYSPPMSVTTLYSYCNCKKLICQHFLLLFRIIIPEIGELEPIYCTREGTHTTCIVLISEVCYSAVWSVRDRDIRNFIWSEQ